MEKGIRAFDETNGKDYALITFEGNAVSHFETDFPVSQLFIQQLQTMVDYLRKSAEFPTDISKTEGLK